MAIFCFLFLFATFASVPFAVVFVVVVGSDVFVGVVLVVVFVVVVFVVVIVGFVVVVIGCVVLVAVVQVVVSGMYTK